MGLLGSLLGGIGGKGGMGGMQAPKIPVPDAKSLLSGIGGGGTPTGMPGTGPSGNMPKPMAPPVSGAGNMGPMTGASNMPGNMLQPQQQTPMPKMGGMMQPPPQGGLLSGMQGQIKQPQSVLGQSGPMSQPQAMPGMAQKGLLGNAQFLGQQPAPMGQGLMTDQQMKPGLPGLSPPQPQTGAPPQLTNMLKQGMDQSTPGLMKTMSSFNPLGSANAAPAGDQQLGSLSKIYESGNKGVTAMNPEALGRNSGDKGGPSYGAYQMAANGGLLMPYIKQSPYAKEFQGLKPGTPAFNQKWLELAKDPAFAQSQHDFIKQQSFDPVRAHADKLGVPNDPTINNVLWSTGVQHGAGGANRILDRSVSPNMSKEQIVNNIYNTREKVFPPTKPRYESERTKALQQLKGSSIQTGSLSPVGSANAEPVINQLKQSGYQPNDQKIARTANSTNPYDAATKYLGTNEHEGAPVLQNFFKKAGINIDPSKTPWCAAFVDATLKEGGIKDTGSLMAKSYLNWGNPTSTPTKGDVVVLSRGPANSPEGHVGFYAGTENINGRDYVKILGGNQGDSVSIKSYPADRVLGYRKAPTNYQDAARMIPNIANQSLQNGTVPTGNDTSMSPEAQQSAPQQPQGSFAQRLLSKMSGGDNKSSGASIPQIQNMETQTPQLSSPKMTASLPNLTLQRKMPAVMNKYKPLGQ